MGMHLARMARPSLLLLASALAACSRTSPSTTTRWPASGHDGSTPGQEDAAPDAAGSANDGLPADRVAAADTVPGSCGNGELEPGETCDDGNTLSGDGCRKDCKVECDYGPCLSPIVFVCGDGRLHPGEVCDDSNTASGDGCSGNCEVEPGYHCLAPGRLCVPNCGDRVLKGSESCDDGNTANGDGCSSVCLTEPGWDCTDSTCRRVASVDGGPVGYLHCGDGIVSGAEDCDDGDLNGQYPVSMCNSDCRLLYCGDGLVTGDEECDLGVDNGASYGAQSGCTIACKRPHYCGDGMVDIAYGEQCDLSYFNGQQDMPCTLTCQFLPRPD
jgi:cysteine-rich repeat protein